MIHTQKNHKDRVELAVYDARRRFMLQDLQDLMDHDMAKIEEYFNVRGLEIHSVWVMDNEEKRSFTFEIKLACSHEHFTFQYHNKITDAHWPYQSKWGPYEDPADSLKGWCLVCQNYRGIKFRYLAQDCKLEEAVFEHNRVRNLADRWDTR